jgi:hypothetical protein
MSETAALGTGLTLQQMGPHLMHTNTWALNGQKLGSLMKRIREEPVSEKHFDYDYSRGLAASLKHYFNHNVIIPMF